MATVEVITWGHERARAGAWRGHSRVAYLSPLPGEPVPSAGFVRRCLDSLRARGFAEVVTGALAPSEQRSFLAAGFEVREHLVLLARELDDLPPLARRPAWGRVRRARPADHNAALAVDALAFQPFWRLDEAGLDEALSATPSARFRLAGEPLLGYAISGRAAKRGYLQRLAVHPAHQGKGIGRHLVLDALHWMRNRGVERTVVNTQPDNDAALALYSRLGFAAQPIGLDVLARALEPAT